jgi:hypothetical protein
MAESDRTGKAYGKLGLAGSPAWNAGLPTFISDTKDWFGRIQPVIDSHPDADPYLRRGLQRLIDDRRFLVADLEAGPFQTYDDTIWQDSLAAYTGPLNVCYDLGVTW